MLLVAGRVMGMLVPSMMRRMLGLFAMPVEVMRAENHLTIELDDCTAYPVMTILIAVLHDDGPYTGISRKGVGDGLRLAFLDTYCLGPNRVTSTAVAVAMHTPKINVTTIAIDFFMVPQPPFVYIE